MRNRCRPTSIALTFDDGPHPDSTPAILGALADAGAQATFFVIAGQAPELIDRILAGGHEVGYHCRVHVRHGERRRAEVVGELREDLLQLGRLGARPQAWRTPWGDLAPWSAGLATARGLQLWGWSDDTEDWAGHRADSMLSGLERTLGPGSVVLMHDGLGPGALRSDCAETVELIGPLVELARSRGLEPARLADPRLDRGDRVPVHA